MRRRATHAAGTMQGGHENKHGPEQHARPTWYETGADPTFTERELDMLSLLADGLNGREIATRWVVSLHTVRHHGRNLRFKTGRRTMAGAVALAIRTGLIQ